MQILDETEATRSASLRQLKYLLPTPSDESKADDDDDDCKMDQDDEGEGRRRGLDADRMEEGLDEEEDEEEGEKMDFGPQAVLQEALQKELNTYMIKVCMLWMNVWMWMKYGRSSYNGSMH